VILDAAATTVSAWITHRMIQQQKVIDASVGTATKATHTNGMDAKVCYSLRPIILFANMDVSRHILVVDTFVFAKSNMGRREY
jgi:hypothetical protein